MSRPGFSVYEFTTNGFRAVLDNVRLVILAALSCLGSFMLAGLGSMLILTPTFLKLRPLIGSLKPALAHPAGIIDKAAQAKMAADVWHQVQPALNTIDIALALLSMIFFFMVMLGVVAGFFRIALDVVEQGHSSVSRVWSCLKYAPRLFVATLMSMIIIVLGLIAFVVPGIILTLRLRFFMFYIFDKNMGAIESLKASWNDTKGMEWEVLGLNIVAAVLAMIVPVIGVPVSCFMFAYAYKALPR